MPYWKCNKCHHEWEEIEEEKCDWCGSDTSVMLEEATPLERFVKVILKNPKKSH